MARRYWRQLAAVSTLASILIVAVAAVPAGASLPVAEAGALVNSAAWAGTINGPYYPGDGCTVWVGDQQMADRSAIGAAEIECPATRTIRMKVYLDNWSGSSSAGAVTVSESISGAPIYDPAGTWITFPTQTESCKAGYWATYAEVSIDGGPYHGWYTSQLWKPYAAC